MARSGKSGSSSFSPSELTRLSFCSMSFWDKMFPTPSHEFIVAYLTSVSVDLFDNTSQKYHAINSVHRGTLVIDGIELIRKV